MKSLVLTSTLGIALILLIGGSPRWPQTTGSATRDTDAAFRDGLFQARLDAQNGRKPHIASARWTTNGDRALFIAGYQQGYRQFAEAHLGRLMEPDAAELAGHRDGMLDGARHRRASQPFQVSKTDNYHAAGPGDLELNSDPGRYKKDYRLAYSNGYQEGYYSQEQEELKAANSKAGRL
jgi:hypothetical protein